MQVIWNGESNHVYYFYEPFYKTMVAQLHRSILNIGMNESIMGDYFLSSQFDDVEKIT